MFTEQIEKMLSNPEIYKYSENIYNYYKTIEIMNKFFSDSEDVVIWGGGESTKKLLPYLYNENLLKISCIVDSNKNIQGNRICNICVRRPDEISVKKTTQILISSFNGRKSIADELKQRMPHVISVDLYEIVPSKSKKPFYIDSVASYFSISDAIMKLTIAKGSEKIVAVKRLIGEYYSARDFENAFIKTDELLKLSRDDALFYINLKNKILKLLGELKHKISGKNHIVINWIDALRPDQIKEGTFLSRLFSEGIVFENAYTVVPYTSPTMKTIFTGKLYIEDKLYKMNNDQYDNTILYKTICENGYEFSYIGRKINEGIFYNRDVELLLARHVAPYNGLVMSELEWILLLEMEYKDNVFFIVHTIEETHAPFANACNVFHKYSEAENDRTFYKGEASERKKLLDQIDKSIVYVNEQLEFYYNIYSDVRYIVFMSDHGKYMGEKPFSLYEMYHVFFTVLGRNIDNKRIKGLFSYINFPSLIKCLMNNSFYDISKLFSLQYLLIEMDDVYNENVMNQFKENEEVVKYLYIQHRGVMTKNEGYVKYITGKEYYFKSGKIQAIDEHNMNNVNKLRKFAGNIFINIQKEEKYANAVRLYKTMNYHVAKCIDYI